MSALWMGGAVALAVLLLVSSDCDTPGGRAGVMLGVMLVVGAVLACALLAVNGSLGRQPDREDARGAADLLTFAMAVVTAATVVLVLAFGSPIRAGVAALALLGLLLFSLLLGVGLWTRSAATRRGRPRT